MFKVANAPGFSGHSYFMACAANHAGATDALRKLLDDDDKKIIDSQEQREGLAEFMGVAPGGAMLWVVAA